MFYLDLITHHEEGGVATSLSDEKTEALQRKLIPPKLYS